jgi:hypothetical protein
MRYFRDTEDDSVIATEESQYAEDLARDERYVEIDKETSDDLIDSDPWRP